ncbi:hypothetical protein [Joostella sp. CR20]|uniref:hypothetical protein n=1 Tax=Joostella sp. CR20 TaxID=2804312 RepID=UPI00313CE80C
MEKQVIYICTFFIFVIVLQPIIGLLLFNLIENNLIINYFPLIKDFMIFSIFGLMLLYVGFTLKIKREYLRVYIYFSLLLFFIAVSFFYSEANFYFKIYNIRRILILYLIFFSFHGLYQTNNFRVVKKVVLIITLSICVFGMIEYFLPDIFWNDWLNLPNYWNNDTQGGIEIKGLKETGRGYTSDLYFLFHEKYRRMLSFFLEPSTLGSYFSYIFAFYYFSKKFKYKKYFLTLVFICGLMVFSKIFILSIILILAIDILKFNLKLSFILMTPLFIYLGYLMTEGERVHGSFSHIIGVYTGFEVAINDILGRGVGMAGNRPMNPTTNIVNGMNGAESGFGNVLAQMGLSGIIISIILYYIMSRAYLIYKQTNNSDYYGLAIMILVYYLNYNLSASSLALTGNFIVFTLAGIYLNKNILMTNKNANSIF